MLEIRRKNGRQITALAQWQQHYLALVATVRSGEHGKSIQTLIDVRDDVGANTAADRKVRVDASKALLGDDNEKLSVNVTVNQQTTIKAGYVIRLGGERPPVTIEGEVARAGPPRHANDGIEPLRPRAPSAPLPPAGSLPTPRFEHPSPSPKPEPITSPARDLDDLAERLTPKW